MPLIMRTRNLCACRHAEAAQSVSDHTRPNPPNNCVIHLRLRRAAALDSSTCLRVARVTSQAAYTSAGVDA